MRQLVKQFWKVPIAAICCALGNIKPVGKTFSTASADKFIDLVEGEKMFARILHIDSTVSIVLWKSSDLIKMLFFQELFFLLLEIEGNRRIDFKFE